MPYRKEQFVNNEYYHILNRGIDKRTIFQDEADYRRFLDGLREFNTEQSVSMRAVRHRNRVSDIRHRNPVSVSSPPLVNILCYCLLPNHFHLMLKQLVENGIQEFMHKFMVGYTKYFNTKNERLGHLFQGPFKAVPIEGETQLLHISRYIHLNALDLSEPRWRKGEVADWGQAKKYLEDYPWSSYPIFVEKQTSEFCDPELLKDIFKNPQDYDRFLQEWTERSLSDTQDMALE